MSELSFFIAFGAGFISFASPCVLPLVPVYLANLAGFSTLAHGKGLSSYYTPLYHALFFVAGFALVFTALGAAAGLTGFAAAAHLKTLSKIAGGLLIFFGIYMVASQKIPWLNFEKRWQFASRQGIGYTRSFLIGAAFSLGWTPCIGPILGAVLTLAAASETVWQGAYLLTGYSSGLGLPLIIFSFFFEPISLYLKRFSRYIPYVSLIAGLLLILIGTLMFFDRLL